MTDAYLFHFVISEKACDGEMPSSAVSSGESVAMKENRTADLEMAVLVQVQK